MLLHPPFFTLLKRLLNGEGRGVQQHDSPCRRRLGWARRPDDPNVAARLAFLRANNGIKGLEIVEPHEVERAVALFNRDGCFSRWRDWHSAAPRSTFSRCVNSDGERASAK